MRDASPLVQVLPLLTRRVVSSRSYSGASNSVDGGAATGGGGINLIKVLAHNGTSLTRLFIADRPRALSSRVFPPYRRWRWNYGDR